MWEVATPIVVGGNHLGNLFTGQFFFDEERPDHELFRAQAARYGFDEGEYLAALGAVPSLSRALVAAVMAFFIKFAAMLSHLSYSNIKLAHSVAERELLMRSLEAQKQHLEEADRRKTQFLAVLSHELRNPLAPIRNSVYLLDRTPPGTDQEARTREILRRQTDHLTRLVDDLLDVTRFSRGRIELRRTSADARVLVHQACDDHRALFLARGLELCVDAAGPVWIDADVTRVAQVVGNLLQNAAKFSEEGGTVVVSVSAAGGNAEIRVRDAGIGIAPDLLPRVFDPFVQAECGLARSRGGLGLGLALVKDIVELHGGSARAYSEGSGRGAEFVVNLPLASAPRPVRPDGPFHPRRAIEVLVIEDNPDAARSIADVLEMEGHVVHVATDGRSGIARACELRPHVVLCDIGLPDVGGYEVARILRRDEGLRATRLIALSGYAQPEDRRRSLEAGFDAHVSKPASLEALLDLVAQGGNGELPGTDPALAHARPA
jgi:signal transduction histidine kinase/CheY-like chemotaxis protein